MVRVMIRLWVRVSVAVRVRVMIGLVRCYGQGKFEIMVGINLCCILCTTVYIPFLHPHPLMNVSQPLLHDVHYS